LILKYCIYHNFIKPAEIIRPLQYNDLKRCVTDVWDAEFVNVLDFEQVTELLCAADKLECTSLTDLCYARLAMYFRSII
jgi:hypothetical protein